MCTDENKPRIAGCSCVFLLTAVVLFGLSFATIHPLEMGLVLDTNLMQLDTSKVHYGGRNFVGVGRDFIRFPITYQTVQLGHSFDLESRDGGSITCRSLDGMVISMDISFSYIIKREPENMGRLYRDTGGKEGWHALYIRKAYASIRDVTAKFAAFDFFVKRNDITDAMKARLNSDLERVYANVLMFELVNMEMDWTFAAAIEDTQVARQDILQAEAERAVAVIEAQSDLAVRSAEARILVKTALATAFETEQSATAQAAALLAHTQATIAGFKALSVQLNLSAAEMLTYQYVSAMTETAASDLLMNLPFPDAFKM